MNIKKKKFDSNTINIKANVNEVLAETELVFNIKVKKKKQYLDFNLKYVDDNIIFSNFIIKSNFSTISSKIVSNIKNYNFEENYQNCDELSNYSLIKNTLEIKKEKKKIIFQNIK